MPKSCLGERNFQRHFGIVVERDLVEVRRKLKDSLQAQRPNDCYSKWPHPDPITNGHWRCPFWVLKECENSVQRASSVVWLHESYFGFHSKGRLGQNVASEQILLWDCSVKGSDKNYCWWKRGWPHGSPHRYGNGACELHKKRSYQGTPLIQRRYDQCYHEAKLRLRELNSAISKFDASKSFWVKLKRVKLVKERSKQ